MDSPNVDATIFTLPWADLLGYERLSDPQKAELLRAAKNALEMRVGGQLMRFMSEQDVRQFDLFLQSPEGSDKLGAALLARMAPGYEKTVYQNVSELENELKRIVADFDAGAPTIDQSRDNLGRRQSWGGQDGDEFEQPTDQ